MSTLRIKSIWLDEAMCDENGNGMAVNVILNNGADFTVTLDTKANEPLFRDVTRRKSGEPRTDGERVYWNNGASLTIEDMMDLLRAENHREVSP